MGSPPTPMQGAAASAAPSMQPASAGTAGGTAMTITDWNTLLSAVKTLCRLKTLTTASVEKMLGTPVRQTDDFSTWTHYEAKMSRGIAESVELRIKKDGSEGLIVLKLSAKADRLSLAKSAKALGSSIRPHIVSPPLSGKPDWEYKYYYEHRVEGQAVSFGYEDRKGKTDLVSVVIKWKRP